jgi:hypothetical protein
MSTRARTTRRARKLLHHSNNGDTGQQQLEKNRALIELVEAWVREDTQREPHEVQAEWEKLKAGLDAGRLSDRKLFP